MKTVFHIGRPARDGETRSAFSQKICKTPVTDWGFHVATPVFRGGAGPFGGKKRASFRALRALGNRYFDAEARRHEKIDAAIFGIFATFCSWPIGLAAQAVWHLMK